MQTTIGQPLDLLILSPKTNAELFDFKTYTHESYDAIVKWKTANYSFYLPFACALYLVRKHQLLYFIIFNFLLHM